MSLDEWMATAADALGVDLATIGDIPAVRTELLDLARDAAHGVARPAAPLTTFLIGVAIGQGLSLDEAAVAIRRVLPEPPQTARG